MRLILVLLTVFLLVGLGANVFAAIDGNVVKIDGNPDTSPLPAFSFVQDGNLTIDFNVSSDLNNMLIDLNYSSTNAQGTGTAIVTDLNGSILGTTGPYRCNDTDFTNTTNCFVDFNTLAAADGNYFILLLAHNGVSTKFNASDANFMVDNTKPSTIWDGNSSTWQVTDANIHLTCSDGSGRGCSTTKYRLDTDSSTTNTYGAWTAYSAAAGIVISTDGNWIIDFNSTDGVANIGDTNTFYVLLDKTAPSTTSDANSYTWQVTDANVHLTCADANSGCASTKYRVDSDGSSSVTIGAWTAYSSAVGIVISTDGNWAIDFNSTDNAGKIETTNRVYVQLDKTAPSTTSDANSSAWQVTDANVHLTCADANSGCASTKYRIDTDSNSSVTFGAWTTYSSSTGIVVTTDGNWGIDFNSTDSAGKIETTNRAYVLLDSDAPTTTSDANSYTWQNTDANVHLTCTDAGQGCATTKYRLDTDSSSSVTIGAWAAYTAAGIVITTDGNWAIDFNSTDSAGFVETTNRVYVQLDKSGPSISISSPASGASIQSGTVTLVYSGSDSLSGLLRYDVSADGSSWTSNGTLTTYNFTNQASGTRRYYARAVDNVSNSTAVGVTVEVNNGGSGSGGGSGGGGGGGGSGGSGGGTSEQEGTNTTLTAGQSFTIEFTKPDVHNVTEIDFTSTQTMDGVHITVKAATTPTSTPSEHVYKYIDITPTKPVAAGTFNATVRFRVPKAWISGQNKSVNDVVMLHSTNNTWENLSTQFVSEDATYAYYAAQTSSFSTFALALSATPATIAPPTTTPVEPSPEVITPPQPKPVSPTPPYVAPTPAPSNNNIVWLIVIVGVVLLAVIVNGMRKKK